MSFLKTAPTNAAATATLVVAVVVALVAVLARAILQVVALRYVNNSFIIIPSEKKKEHLFLYFHYEKKKKPWGRVTRKPSFAIPTRKEKKKKEMKKERRSFCDDTSAPSIFAHSQLYIHSAQVVWNKSKEIYSCLFLFAVCGLTPFSSWMGNTSIAFSFLGSFFAILFYTCYMKNSYPNCQHLVSLSTLVCLL